MLIFKLKQPDTGLIDIFDQSFAIAHHQSDTGMAHGFQLQFAPFLGLFAAFQAADGQEQIAFIQVMDAADGNLRGKGVAVLA